MVVGGGVEKVDDEETGVSEPGVESILLVVHDEETNFHQLMSSHSCLSPLTFKVKCNLCWQIEATYSHLYCTSERRVPIYYNLQPRRFLFCHFSHLHYQEKMFPIMRNCEGGV